MRIVSIFVIAFAILAIATGVMDILAGTPGQANVGVAQAVIKLQDPTLDSQVRYLGGIWLGLGLMQLLCLRDPARFRPALECTFAAVVLGGIGRVLSCYEVGLPDAGTGRSFVIAAMFIELILIPILWLAFRAVMRGWEDRSGQSG